MAKSLPSRLQISTSETPVRDASSLTQFRYRPGHEKYPSWPIPESSVAHVDPAGQYSSDIGCSSTRSKSFADQTEYTKESVPTYSRPYMRQLTGQLPLALKTVTENIWPDGITTEERKSFTCATSNISVSGDGSNCPGAVNLSQVLVEPALGCRVVATSQRYESVPSPPSRDTNATVTSSEEWDAYSKKYAHSEGYHSYISSESVVGSNMGTPFLDLLRRETTPKSSSWINSRAAEVPFDEHVSLRTSSWKFSEREGASIVVPSCSAFGIKRDTFRTSMYSPNSASLTVKPSVVGSLASPSLQNRHVRSKSHTQKSLHSRYSYCGISNIDSDQFDADEAPKLSPSSRSVSASNVQPDTQTQRENRKTKMLRLNYDRPCETDSHVHTATAATVAERVSDLEKSCAGHTEYSMVVHGKTGSRDNNVGGASLICEGVNSENTAKLTAYNGDIPSPILQDSVHIDRRNEATNVASKPAYSYLDPQKKLRVADLTLKAIQKQALLSYYERHTGKPASVVSPSSEDNFQRTFNADASAHSLRITDTSGKTVENVVSMAGLNFEACCERFPPDPEKIARRSEPDVWPSNKYSTVASGISRKDCENSMHHRVSITCQSGIATAVVAPLHFRDREPTSIDSRLSMNRNRESEDGEVTFGGLSISDTLFPPPKRPPKKARPNCLAAAGCDSLNVSESATCCSPPPPLPRAPLRHGVGVFSDRSLDAGIISLTQSLSRCTSPELPLPPPPQSSMHEEFQMVLDEPLPPPPSNMDEVHNKGKRWNFSEERFSIPFHPPPVEPTSPNATKVLVFLSKIHGLATSNGSTKVLLSAACRAGCRSDVPHSEPPPESHKHGTRAYYPAVKEVTWPAPTACSCDAELPSDSAYFTTSECKAKLLTQYKDVDSGILCVSNGTELLKQKEELVSRISRKLEILRAEQLDIRDEINSNEQLGRSVRNRVEQKAKANEFVKFNIHTEEIGKITSLLLGLSGRLARAENALMGLSDKYNPQEKAILEGKRDKLKHQLHEAKALKESIDVRSAQVSGFLGKYLTSDEYEDYLHFMKMKAKLIIDAREIDDKIKLGHEQMVALQEALAL